MQAASKHTAAGTVKSAGGSSAQEQVQSRLAMKATGMTGPKTHDPELDFVPEPATGADGEPVTSAAHVQVKPPRISQHAPKLTQLPPAREVKLDVSDAVALFADPDEPESAPAGILRAAPGVPEPKERPPALADFVEKATPAYGPPELPLPVVIPATPSELAVYKQQKKRLRFKLAGGSVMMTAVDFVDAAPVYVMVVGTDSDGCVFIPGDGEQVTVECDRRSIKCVAPGIVFDIAKLGLTFVILLAQSETAQGDHAKVEPEL